MSTLLEQITEYRQEITARRNAIDVYELALRKLEDSRVDCKHQFSKSIVGYEHEGGTCLLCGINEIHAYTLNSQRLL